MIKSIIVVCMLLGAGAASASSIPAGTVSVTPQMAPSVIKLYDPGVWFYELTTGAYDALTTFKLLDTSEDGSTVKYTLYSDTDVADNSYVLGSELTAKNIVDDQLPDFFNYLLMANSDYVLKIENIDPIDFSKTQISAVPLPGAALLFGSVLAGAGFMNRKKMFKGNAVAA